jgi:hypothetical protein
MRLACLTLAVLMTLAAPISAADALSEARRLYNLGQYENAERSAREALRSPAVANAARVVLGRIQLERYRRTSVPEDLVEARTSLRAVDPRVLDGKERIELVIGLAETLYLEDLFGSAAELFGIMLDRSNELGAAAHERVLDWWATASDRQVQSGRSADRPASTNPPTERQETYDRLLARMTAEIAKEPGSTPAVYWLVAAARNVGDLDRAWSAAMAAWTLAPLMRDGGVALRADLDQLVVQAIIPDRVVRLPQRERTAAQSSMAAEWDAFKTRWGQ